MSAAATETLARVIAFPSRPPAEPEPATLAESTIASLVIESHLRSRAQQSTNWQRHRWFSYCEGMVTAMSIALAGEAGEDQWLIAQAVGQALKAGITDPDRLVAIAKSPQDPITA